MQLFLWMILLTLCEQSQHKGLEEAEVIEGDCQKTKTIRLASERGKLIITTRDPNICIQGYPTAIREEDALKSYLHDGQIRVAGTLTAFFSVAVSGTKNLHHACCVTKDQNIADVHWCWSLLYKRPQPKTFVKALAVTPEINGYFVCTNASFAENPWYFSLKIVRISQSNEEMQPSPTSVPRPTTTPELVGVTPEVTPHAPKVREGCGESHIPIYAHDSSNQINEM